MDWNSYHRLTDIYDYLYYLEQTYPQLVEVINIGKSVEKRPMLLLKIGSKKFTDKPAIFIEGGKVLNEFSLKRVAKFPRYMRMSQNVSEDIKMSQNSKCLRRFQKVSEGLRRSQKVSEGLRRSSKVSEGL